MKTTPRKPVSKGGGPNSDKGKQISSQNAIVHGATSNNATGAAQRDLVQRYEEELTSHYKPTSPLERLQIQRIALCRAKLDALYALEQTKLQIAAEDLTANPKQAMDRVYSSADLTQSFALTLSGGRRLDLPMNLTPELLASFSAEIKGAGGVLRSEDDLYAIMPGLGKFVDDIAVRLKISDGQALLRIGDAIREMLEKKDANQSRLTEVFNLGLEVIKARKRGDKVLVLQSGKDVNEDDIDTKKTNEALSAIVDLNQMVMNAKEISQNFSRMQDLMLRSVTLSGEESDRLMRYQTTWERRLSSAMGELLALQAKNGN
ncbi:MAG: hypothetical protein WCO80_07550 [Betaproteobacteria bacterium]